MLKRNGTNLLYTTDLSTVYTTVDVIFIAVGTPEKRDGSANLAYVWQTVQEIADNIQQYCVVLVPVYGANWNE